jgi:hypothetical protein
VQDKNNEFLAQNLINTLTQKNIQTFEIDTAKKPVKINKK